MGDFWENKYQNAEKSIEFLKATHAEVLKGLHEEIENLQKQCSGLLSSFFFNFFSYKKYN